MAARGLAEGLAHAIERGATPMWIAASFGFLMPAIRPVDTVPYGDERTMQIRARRSKDLDILRAKYMRGKLGPSIHTPHMDYEFRAYCTPEAFALAVAQMVTEIDYKKFKPTTLDYGDHQLHKVYNSIWSVVIDGLSTQQHQDEYWGTSSGKPKPAKGGKHRQKTVSTQRGPKVYQTSSTGYPKVVGSSSSAGSLDLTIDGALAEYDRYQDWLREHANPGHRDTSATRDDAARVPDVIDAEWADDDTLSPPADAIDDILVQVDALENEIAEILVVGRQQIDHSRCHHADTASARGRCRGKNRKAEMRRVAELRGLVDQLWKDAEAATKGSDLDGDYDRRDATPAPGKGYPWERDRARDYAIN